MGEQIRKLLLGNIKEPLRMREKKSLPFQQNDTRNLSMKCKMKCAIVKTCTKKCRIKRIKISVSFERLMFTPLVEFQRSMPGFRQLAQSACPLKSLTKIKNACCLNKRIKPTDFKATVLLELI